MRSDAIARLAAANPVPRPAATTGRVRINRTRVGIAVAIALVAVTAAAAIADTVGISNNGNTVPTSDVLPGQTSLDKALEDMSVGQTMQYLGTLDGVAFYATRNASGHFCVAIDHVNAQTRRASAAISTPTGSRRLMCER